MQFSVRRYIFILPLLACLLPTSGLAQKNELSFTVGGITSSDQTLNAIGACPVIIPTCPLSTPVPTTMDAGVAFEGTFAHRLFHSGPASLAVEVPLLGAPGRNLTFGGSAPGTPVSSLFFTPSARLQLFHSKAISPFASVGGGLAHFGFTGGDANHGALQFGGGLDFKTPIPHLAFRVEIRDFYATSTLAPSNTVSVSPSRANNVFGGGGAVLRF